MEVVQESVVGWLAVLWTWELDGTLEYNIAPEYVESVAEVMGYDGEPRTLIEALVAAGFVDEVVERQLLLHDGNVYAYPPTRVYGECPSTSSALG